MRLWRCGDACNSRAFRPQIVYTRPPFAGGFCLLLAVNLLGAGGAVFCSAGAGEDALAADFAAAEFLGPEDGLFQLWLLGQHGAAKPATKQTAGDVLRANTVQQQALAIQEVAAALCKAAHVAELPRRQAEERAVWQPLDGVKLVHLRPPLR